MFTINHGTVRTATTVAPVRRKALPLHVLFNAGIILGFVFTAMAVPFVFGPLPDMTLTGVIMAALAFGSVGGAAGLLAVGLYDVIVSGSLENLQNMPD